MIALLEEADQAPGAVIVDLDSALGLVSGTKRPLKVPYKDGEVGGYARACAGTHVLVQLLFTPLLAGWAIWVGIAVSTRSSDVRVAQQLSVLARLPPLIIVALMSPNVITESTALVIGLAAALLAVDLLAWRFVAAMFDGEWLVTGRRG